MILQLPPQCLEMVMKELSLEDLLSLAKCCHYLNDTVRCIVYEKIYYYPGYQEGVQDDDHRTIVITRRDQLEKFLSVERDYKFGFVNLSREKEIKIEGSVIDLDQVGDVREGEFYVPVKLEDFPENLSEDFLTWCRGDEKLELRLLSLVVRNWYQIEEFDQISLKIRCCDNIRDLELIVLDDGGKLDIFKSLLVFMKNFPNLDKLSVIYMCEEDDGKNNLRIMMINSVLMNVMVRGLRSVSIYLDLVNLQMNHLVMLYYQLDRFDGYIDFNANLEKLTMDYMILKDLNFFKNFFSNSSIVLHLVDEFIEIDRQHFNFLLYKLNSNLRKLDFNCQLDYRHQTLFSQFFLSDKIKRNMTLFNLKFRGGAITNIYNYSKELPPNFETDLTDISSIFHQ